MNSSKKPIVTENNIRISILGPCFSGKTYLFMHKNLSSELNNPDGKLNFFYQIFNQYLYYHTEKDVSSIDKDKKFVVVFDDMLENKQKDISPFFNH